MRLKPALKRLHREPPWAGACSPPCAASCPPPCSTLFRKREQNRGITVMATTNEASSERQKARASAEHRNLLTAYRKVTGKKSTTSTRVAASTARFTTCPPTP